MLLKNIITIIRCPICKNKLIIKSNNLKCLNINCNNEFPIVNGIPILINKNNSLFSISSFKNKFSTTISLKKETKFVKIVRKVRPTIGFNLKSINNYKLLVNLLNNKHLKKHKVLIIGGRLLGKGIQFVTNLKNIVLIESDVSFGPRTKIILDGHDIPFADNSIDCVIIQAVLEHVIEPIRVVDEIHRVLKQNGLIYSEIPFMQQVHEGPFDFTRFTHLGQKKLFKNFKEIKSGTTGGPGMALAWSYKYFLMSFTKSKIFKKILREFAHFTSFYLKYFDYYLIDKPGSYDAASGFYFLGRKNRFPLDDKKLIKQYKGLG